MPADELLAPVGDAFRAMAQADPALSAQLCVYLRGEPVLDLACGAMGPDSLLPVFSSSKGAAGVVVAVLVERGVLDLDQRVCHYWPEFAAAGKAGVTVRQALSHQAGLNGVDGGFTYDELTGHEELAAKLAAQRPFWAPGSAFLYHALTIGTIADELVRRTTGRSLRDVLTEDVLAPRAIDCWMGTPPAQDHRVLPVLLPEPAELVRHLEESGVDLGALDDGIASRSTPPGDVLELLARVNDAGFQRVGVPAAGMLASARGLARLYAALRHDVGGPRLLSDDTVAQVSQTQVFGLELGTGLVARFGVLFQVPFAPRWPFASFRGFGHDGAGGSLAFCDPHYDLALGYTVQQVPLPGGMDARAVQLSQVARQCLAAAPP